MFERFTDRARRVVVLAQEEARILNHSHIGTEHLLLGLIHEGDGVAAEGLDALGVSLDRVRDEVVGVVGRGLTAPTGDLPFTPRAKTVLELSLREAQGLGHTHIGTEHILLGLVREGEGVAAQVLRRLGVDLSRAREEVSGALAEHGGDEPPAAPSDRPDRSDRRPRRFRRRPGEPSASFTDVERGRAMDVERLDDAAWRALLAARAAARRRDSPLVEPADVVVGVAETDGPGRAALAAVGVDPSALPSVAYTGGQDAPAPPEEGDTRTSAGADPQRPERAGGEDPQEPVASLPMFSEPVRLLLAWAVDEAERHGHPAAGTAHLLLALLVTSAPTLLDVLDRVNASPADLRAEIARRVA